MYSKDQASQIRQSFWTTFGLYIAPHPSADGTRINWINYRTGVKHLYFRMTTDNRSATIGIDYTHPDADIRALFFEQFEAFKTLFTAEMGDGWQWLPEITDESGKTICRISKTLQNASIFNRDDWPGLIPFFKDNIIALDEFWSTAQYSFDLFR